MKLQNLTVIFIIIILPVVLLVSFYISTGLRAIKYQSLYDSGLLTAMQDAIYAFEQNTTNDSYSNNAETKRNILKASINAFEKQLANTCNIPSYRSQEIEEYIPAIVFGMYDGFYMYAPSELYNQATGKNEYKHGLKNYVYYSEEIDEDKGIVIKYSLDNYVSVSGEFNGTYQSREGYLIDLSKTNSNGTSYAGVPIDSSDTAAINYYKEAYSFTNWFLNTAQMGSKNPAFKINSSNDPEDENSLFTQHKREVMRNKIENVLNSSISAYSERTWKNNYKMPRLSENDWQKIYSNISMIAFFQGKNIGFTKYNGYCVLNSTNNNEYVNPNLIYFIDSQNPKVYHDIRCPYPYKIGNLTGYKVGSFSRKKVETTDAAGTTTTSYEYEHDALACYNCVNGSHLNATQTVYEYVRSSTTDINDKKAYFTALGRERYNTIKLLNQ